MSHRCDRCLAVIEITETSAQYCEFCCPAGTLLYVNDDVHTFRQRYFDKMHAEGANEFVARFHTLLIGHAPYWQQRRY